MRILLHHEHRSEAFSLLECLTYIVLFFVIAGVAFSAYYRLDEHTRGFSRNSADIAQAMKAGERWREDLRRATAVPQLENDNVFHITQKAGDVRYTFRDGAMWRQAGNERASIQVLANLKTSAMKPDARRHVTAWRWELELQTKRKDAAVRPLFTFLAAPGTEASR